MAARSILCVSYDRTVLESRSQALQECGYEVAGTLSIEEAFDLLLSRKFDLVIIGHRFPKSDKKSLAAEVRDHWETPLVLICGATPETDIAADEKVNALDGTPALVAAAQRLLGTRAAAA